MKHLVDKEKFLAEINDIINWKDEPGFNKLWLKIDFDKILSKHLEDIKDEPHHPSGMNHHDINVRNALRKELRGGK